MSLTPTEHALWANSITRQCLLEADGDIDAALMAADYILSTQPIPLSIEDVQGHLHSEDDGRFVNKNVIRRSPTQMSIGGKTHQKGEVITDSVWELASNLEKWRYEKYTKELQEQTPASAPTPAPTSKIPRGADIFWRIQSSHSHNLSTSWKSEIADSGEYEEATSATHSLEDLIRWAGSVGFAPTGEVAIVAFRGKQVGVGSDNEPLVKPIEEVARFTHDNMIGWNKFADPIDRMDDNDLTDHLHRNGWKQSKTLGVELSVSAFLSHDIHNREAQAILNRSLKAVRGLSAAARRDLAAAIKSPTGSGEAILAFVDRYRLQLARLLNTTQLASLLEGAREVAEKVPPLGTVPIEGLPIAEQERIAVTLPTTPPPTPPFTPPKPPADSPEGIHYPTIDEAVKHLAEKNVLTRPQYDALDAAARAKAFTVANVAAEETLTKIRDSLAENVKEGADYETWKGKVLQDVDEGTFMSDAHSEVIFRTNVQSAFSDGQMSVLSHPLVRSGFPYSAYDAIHDDRVRENHLALEKLGIGGTNIYRTDDPVFQMFRPPWDYNDRCGWTPLTVRQASERGVEEAKEWMETGVEPADKSFVPMPPFQPPEGFKRAVSSAPLSIQLSMQSMSAFSHEDHTQPTYHTVTLSIDPEEHPRNTSNQYLDKHTIVEAANEPEVAEVLRESLPEEQRWKLDRAISHLQMGGTIHHPNEPLGLGVDISGDIPDKDWAEYADHVSIKTDWIRRRDSRTECRKCAEKATKLIRKDKPDLDEADAHIKDAGATGADIRAIARLRHKVESDSANTVPASTLSELYEDVIEAIHRRIDDETERDAEPDEPEEPTKSIVSMLLSIGDDDKNQLIAEILVHLFGKDAPKAAMELSKSEEFNDQTLSIMLATPKVTRRYGKKPGPGWRPGGMSSKGVQIWLYGVAPSRSSAVAPVPSAPATPTAPAIAPSAPTPIPVAPSPTPAPIARGGGPRARAASMAAYNSAMAKLGTGQQLDATDKSSLSTKLTNMPIGMLRSLHTALGGSGPLANAKATVAAVKAILTSATPTPTPAPVPPSAPTPAPTPSPTPAPTSPTPASALANVFASNSTTPQGYQTDVLRVAGMIVAGTPISNSDHADLRTGLGRMTVNERDRLADAMGIPPSSSATASILARSRSQIAATAPPATPATPATPSAPNPSTTRNNPAASGVLIPPSINLGGNSVAKLKTLKDIASGKVVDDNDLTEVYRTINLLDKSEIIELSHWVGGPDMAAATTRIFASMELKEFLRDENDRAIKAATPPPKPSPAASAAAAVKALKTTPNPNNLPVVPMQDETIWTTGKAESGTLNGVDFAPAPPKFWEKIKDVDVKEPPPLRPVERASVMIVEPDGRIWIVKPTTPQGCAPGSGFGRRTHTLPGGGVEKGLTDQQNALKEVWEETGLQVEITGYAGDFEDSNNSKNGRLYIARRIGGAPWDAKVESHIINQKTGKPDAESDTVMLVTPEKAAQLLHRTDDLAQLMVVNPIKVDTPVSGKGSEPLKKLVVALQPKAREYDSKKKGDGELHAVQEMRGFNEKPTVVSKKEMDKLLAGGNHIEVLRGLKDGYDPQTGMSLRADDLAEQYRTGDHFPGYGCFGNGTYVDAQSGSNNAALGQYSNYGNGNVMRIAIPKTAKIIKHSELEKLVPECPKDYKGYGGGHNPKECWLGVQAALAGYDVIEIDGNSARHANYGSPRSRPPSAFHVILNRSILVVQQENAKGYTIK